jgi:hypothetical protein
MSPEAGNFRKDSPEFPGNSRQTRNPTIEFLSVRQRKSGGEGARGGRGGGGERRGGSGSLLLSLSLSFIFFFFVMSTMLSFSAFLFRTHSRSTLAGPEDAGCALITV